MGEDIGAPEREHRIDFRRPTADPRQLHQGIDNGGVRQRAQRGIVDVGACHAKRIADFRTRQATAAQIVLRRRTDAAGLCQPRGLQPRPDRTGRGDADLLADNRVQQCGKAIGAQTQRQIAGQRQCSGKARLGQGQPAGPLGHASRG